MEPVRVPGLLEHSHLLEQLECRHFALPPCISQTIPDVESGRFRRDFTGSSVALVLQVVLLECGYLVLDTGTVLL